MKPVILFTLMLFINQVYAQFDYTQYQESTIEQAAENLNVDPVADYFFEAGNYKYKVDVVFTGMHRNTIEPTQDFIKNWVKVLGHPNDYISLFPFEVEITTGTNTYWLPIQSTLVEPFAHKVKSGERVNLYIMAIGAVNQRPVFIINEFTVQ